MHERGRHFSAWVLAAGMLILGGLAAPGAASAQTFDNPFRVTAAEEELAGRVAGAALVDRELVTDERIHLVSTRIVRDKKAEQSGDSSRSVLATYYRYDGDLTIKIRVDLDRGEVVSVDTRSGLATSLSAEELELAKTIALAVPEIAAANRHPGGVEIEALTVRTAAKDDPLFGKRAVRLLFKTPRGYLSRPIVLVDLTSQHAFIEPSPAETRPTYPGVAEPRR